MPDHKEITKTNTNPGLTNRSSLGPIETGGQNRRTQFTNRLRDLNDNQYGRLRLTVWREMFSDENFPNRRLVGNLGSRQSDPLRDYMAIKLMFEDFDAIGCKNPLNNLVQRVQACHYLEQLVQGLRDPRNGREFAGRVLPIIREFCLFEITDTIGSPRHVDEETGNPLCFADRLGLLNAVELWFGYYFCLPDLDLNKRQQSDFRNTLMTELQDTRLGKTPDPAVLLRALKSQEHISLNGIRTKDHDTYARLLRTVGMNGSDGRRGNELFLKLNDRAIENNITDISRHDQPIDLTNSDMRSTLTGSHHLQSRINTTVTRNENPDLHVDGRTFMVVDDFKNQYRVNLDENSRDTPRNNEPKPDVEIRDIGGKNGHEIDKDNDKTGDKDVTIREIKREPDETKEN